MKTTVVIPAYNEAKTIKEIINKTRHYCDEVLVVVAKKTRDNTAELAKKLGAKVIFDHGKGKGEALRTAIKAVNNGIIVFIDADLSHDPKDIPKLVKLINEGRADLVVASRMRGGSDELHGTLSNFIRNLGGNIIQLCINYRWNVRLTDCENGFRAIKKEVAEKLDLRANDFDIEEEMVIKCLKKDYRIVEVPSHEYERKHGKSRLPLLKIGYKFIWRLIINFF